MTKKTSRLARAIGCIGAPLVCCALFAALGALGFNERYKPPDHIASIAERRLPPLRQLATTAARRCSEARGHNFLEGPPSPAIDTAVASWPELLQVSIECHSASGWEGDFANLTDYRSGHDIYDVRTLRGPLFEWDDYMGSFSSDRHDHYAVVLAEHPGGPFQIRVEQPRAGGGWVHVRATLDSARASTE
jgi:hypothetical protein